MPPTTRHQAPPSHPPKYPNRLFLHKLWEEYLVHKSLYIHFFLKIISRYMYQAKYTFVFKNWQKQNLIFKIVSNVLDLLWQKQVIVDNVDQKYTRFLSPTTIDKCLVIFFSQESVASCNKIVMIIWLWFKIIKLFSN